LNVSAPGVLGNDADIDSASLQAQLVAGPANGVLLLNANGSFSYTPTSGYSGPDSFSYVATDSQATSGVAVVSFTVSPPPDTTSPTVSISSPSAGAAVSGTVTVSANASDNVGVIGVQFLLDGAPLGTEDTNAPFSVSWNTTTATNGSHQLSARARDAATNQATATAVSVTVDNVVAPPPVVGLIAAYDFNDGSGASLADRTGLGHTGTVSGATWTTAGRFGGALSFDGVNDWVTINDANDLDLTTGMTLEAWVYPTASGSGSWRNVVIKERPQGEAYNLYANTTLNVPTVFIVRAAQTGTPMDASGTAAVPANTWTHLSATYDGTTLRLYVNGAQVGTRAVSGAMVTSTGVLRIGGNSLWGEFFAGRIDEVRIYNRALTAAQIQSDMNAAITP
jgi:hypothetical protein